MIPRLLKVVGLHSYREPVEVDFGEAVGDGLFGIFGPTGSGKSTLLDAMTLALYDRVDRLGGKAKSPMLNVDADELSVTYTFELGDTTYQAHRRWVRSGDTTQQREAELRDLDAGETISSQARPTTQAVERLLGMDFEQFTRAVFLPQGKFARFLEDPPRKRLELLEEIFGLDRYGDEVRQRARKRRDELKERFDRIQGTLEEELDDVSQEAVEQLAARAEETAETIATLTEQETQLEEDAQRARKLLETLEQLDDANTRYEELEAKAEAIETKRGRLEEAEAAREPYRTLEDLREQRRALEEAGSSVGELEEETEQRRSRLAETREEREEAAQSLQAREDTLSKIEARLETLAGDAEGLDELREQRSQARGRLENLAEPRNPPPDDVDETRLEEILDTVQEGRRLQDRRRRHEQDRREALEERGRIRLELASLDEDRREAAEQAQATAQALEEAQQSLEQARVHERATVLADELEEGEPCPVCGSPDHPDPAGETDASLEELEARHKELGEEREELDREATRLDERGGNLVERLQEARAASREARGDLVEIREEEAALREKLPEALADTAWSQARQRLQAWRRGRRAQKAQATIEDVDERLEEARERFQLVRETLELEAEEPTEATLQRAREQLEEEASRIQERRASLEEQVEEAEAELDDATERLSEVRGRASTLEERVEELEDRLEEELASTPFDDAEDLADAHEPEPARGRLRESVEAFEDERQQVQAEIERLEEEARQIRLDAEEATERIEEHERVETRLAEAREHHGQLTERLANQRQRLQRKRKLSDELDELEDHLTRAQRLTRLLGGRKFVEYLARSRFDTVLRQASRRLSQVSGGQYRLEGTPSRIEVVDHMAGGEVRDLRTLSGGETFMVSLSLALALSDAIQHQRGGGYPPIEFFFLDEGFGSLDGDRLDQVMRMLHELVDRDVHVGLITHVEEAQRYVPRQVHVQPATEERGSRVEVQA